MKNSFLSHFLFLLFIFTSVQIKAAQPTTAASSVITVGKSTNYISLNWTSGNGTYRIVTCALSTSSVSTPLDGIAYVQNSTFAAGTNLGNGNYCIYNGSSSGCSVFGLSPGIAYRFRIYEYNTVSSVEDYLTSSYPTYTEYTLQTEPITSASNLTFANVTTSSATLSFISGSGTNNLLAMRPSTSYANVPVDGTDYLASTIYGNGTVITGVIPYSPVVYDGTLSSITATSLTPGTTYSAAVFPFNGTIGGTSNYKTTSYPTTTFTTLAAEPTAASNTIAFSNVTDNSMTVSWTIPQSGAGVYRIVTCKQGLSNADLPIDATYYAASSVYGSGAQVGAASGAYVVYWGQGNNITVTGLTSTSDYTFSVFEWNYATNTYNNTYNYLTSSYLTGSKQTLTVEPTVAPTNLVFSNITATSVRTTWANGNGARRLLGVTAGRKHTGLAFDGTNDVVTIPNESNFDFTNQMSVEAWIKVNSFTVADQAIVTKGDDSWSLTRNGTSNALKFTYKYSSVFTFSNTVSGTRNVNDGKWHHVAAVFNGSQLVLYIDGCLDAYISASANIDNSTYQVYIGGNAQTAGKNFNGQIDEVRIWNRGLTASTIRSNMNKTISPNSNGLIGYWKFDDGYSATAVAKNSSFTTAIDGTLSGFTTSAATSFTSTSGWVHSGATVNVPLDYNFYFDNLAFMSNPNTAFYYGDLFFTVYKGPDSTTVNVTNLSPASYYTFCLYDYNGVVSNNNYLTSNYAIGEVVTSAASAPTITSFLPTSGFIGSIVTINGTGFNTTPANNTVLFGTTKATVLTASSTALTVRVPFGSSFESISVTNNSLTAYSTKPYIVTSPCGGTNFSATTVNTGTNATGYPYGEIRVVDFDIDGLSDMIYANYGFILVTRNTSTSTAVNLSSPYVYVQNTYTTFPDVEVGDIDGDGKEDALATSIYGSIPTFTVNKNTSTVANIAFAAAKEFLGTSGKTISDIAVADFDKDGKLDVILSYTDNFISVFKNTSSIGNISFSTKVDYLFGGAATNNVIAIGDIDGDTKMDIAVAGGSGAQINYLRNTSTIGTISFATYTTTALSGSIAAIAIGDIDTDGKPEIIYSSGTSTVGILKNNSTIGTITISASPTSLVALANTPTDIKLGDIDGDGKADIAIGYLSGTQISIFKNNSTASISMAAKNDFTLSGTNTSPASIAICDMNNDSKLDLLSSTTNSTFSYFQNNINPLASEPSVQASNLSFTGINTTQMTLNFTAGNGANRVIFVRAASVAIQYPTDGVGYVPNTIYGNGYNLGGGNYCVYDGNSNTVTVTGLQSNTSYIFSVYEYNGATNCQYNYLLNGTLNSATQATTNIPPTLTAISNPASICQNSGLQTINISGIGTGSINEIQILTFTSVKSSNTGLIPHPTLSYTSPNNTGSLSYTPVNGVSGTAVITVTLDDGASNNSFITRTFTVTVDHTPTTASAGVDRQICPAVASLAGNSPVYGTGLWTIYNPSNGTITITSPTNPTTTVNNFNVTDNARFIWTISSGACASSKDTVLISRVVCPTTADFTANQTSACLNGSPIFTFTDASVASGGNIVSWSWNFGAGAFPPTANTQGPHIVSYSTSGPKLVSLTVIDNLSAQNTASKPAFVNVNDVPDPAGNISGTTTVCQGQNAVTYSVPSISNATGYTWSLPSGATLISGINTSNITVDFGTNAISGNLTVRGTNACGNGTISANFPITINPLPNAAGTITGNTTVCDGATSVAYSVAAITNATTYTWTLPSGASILTGTGTNSITVNYTIGSSGGTLFVHGVNACGNGVASSTFITVNPYPDAAAGITGQTLVTICPSTSNVNYSIPLVNNATSYTWTVPTGATITAGTGTNNITVDYSNTAISGNITVTPVNSCGNGTSSSILITVNTLPESAGVITGNDSISICPASTNIVYTVAPIFNATTYVWSVPSGATIVSGAGTDSINVGFSSNATSGNITVYGQNACGQGASSSLAINVASVETQEICLVTVDTLSNYNKIIWEKTGNNGIDSVRIYREIAGSGFTQIASVDYNALSEYVDNTFLPLANPNTTSHRYKIALVDSCGNESAISNYHRTVFLQTSQGIGNVANLNWNLYEGDSVVMYRIIRDTIGLGNFYYYDSVPGSNNSYTDFYPPLNPTNLRYRLETIWNTACSSTRGTIVVSRSNIKQVAILITGNVEQQIMDETINVYPNPANDFVTVEYPVGFKKYQIQLFDALGQIVYTKEYTDDGTSVGTAKHQININSFTKGVYFVAVTTEGGRTMKRLIIQ